VEEKPASGAVPAAALPRASVLSYVTVVGTPTRVRIVAGRWLVLAGAFVPPIALVWPVIFLVRGFLEYREYTWGWYFRTYHRLPPWMPSVSRIVEDMWRGYVLDGFGAWEWICVGAIPVSICFWIFAPGVKRGNKMACYGGIAAVGPMALVFAGASFYLGLLAFHFGLGVQRNAPNPKYFLALFAAAATIVLMLLLWDIARFMWWIARNPIVEKPAAAFLPRV
jgi:hypothetical protein